VFFGDLCCSSCNTDSLQDEQHRPPKKTQITNKMSNIDHLLGIQESEWSCICLLWIQESEWSCICLLRIQESDRSCICLLGIQESERSCICLLGIQESERLCP
jgi:hypothetical protein